MVLFSSFSLLSNCLTLAQSRHLSQFSHNAISISEMTEKELIQMRNSVMDMNSVRLTLPGVEPEDPSYDDLEENLKISSISLMVQTVNALKSYASLLATLGNDNSDREMMSAAENFLNSTEFLRPENKKINDSQKNEIIKNITILNSAYMNYRKKVALKKVIENTKSQINELCDLLISEFDYKRTQKIALQHQITTNRLLIAAQESINNSTTISNKTKGMRAYRLAQKEKSRREEVYPKIIDSLMLLKKSNQELATAFEVDDYVPKNLKEFSQTIQRAKEISNIIK